MRIGIDIDGVLYQWDKTARYMLREVLPNSPYKKDGPLGKESTHWDYIKEHVDSDHWRWLWKEGVELGLFRYGHLYPGSIVAMRQLATLGELVLITHRPKQALNDTLAWLGYLDLPVAEFHFMNHEQPKSSVRPQCDVYLDDKIENCEDLAKNTKASLVALMDRPWNHRGFSCAVDIKRVYDWRDFQNWVWAVLCRDKYAAGGVK